MRLFSNVWSENTARFERLMEIHSNSPKLYYGFNPWVEVTIYHGLTNILAIWLGRLIEQMSCGLDCFHTTAKCVFWILIRNAHFELKFGRWYFGPCVRQITSRCIIWNAHFEWRSRGVFQLRISQIMHRNHCMNALTSKSWFGGRS